MHGSLWSNSAPGTEHGTNNRVFSYEAKDETYSLRFINAPSVELHVAWRDKQWGKRVDATFRFDGVDYRLAVTDPSTTSRYQNYAPGDYELGERYLTISLAESFGGYCYKLVAAVLRKP